MGRRTSGATVGLEKIGLVQANASTLTTTQTNADMTLDPNGSGQVVVNADMTIADRGDIRLSESASNGTNYIAMQAAAAMASNYTITWPDAVAASAGFLLSSDTSGNLSWVSPGGGIAITDPGAVATIHFPLFATNAGNLPTSLTGANARTSLTFTPSVGELFSTIGRHPDIIGSFANGGTITIRGTSSATKAAASVQLSDGVTSTSTTTGTLVVTGGVGISENMYVGQLVRFTSGTASTTTATGALVVTGGVGVGGQITCNDLVESSSITFKENITPIEDALDKVLQLVGVVYDRKDGSKKDEPGLIAEQVEKIIPNLVSKDESGKIYGIHYTKLVAYLVESIKALNLKIEKLQSHGDS